jgi:allophanate hydrolase subunit 1
MTPAASVAPTILPLGDSALTITIGDHIDPEITSRVRALAAAVRADHAAMAAALEPILSGDAMQSVAAAPAPGRAHLIRVRYDGPDLADVAQRTGLSVADVVARHSGRWYHVYLLGFVPGFAYLGELDPALVLPRRTEPRPRVSAGSVAIAGVQTAVYPLTTPGGWHLIGRTATVLFDPAADPPATLAPGDRVRFVPEESAG